MPLTRAALKDFGMYQDELRREAKLIAQGHQLRLLLGSGVMKLAGPASGYLV